MDEDMGTQKAYVTYLKSLSMLVAALELNPDFHNSKFNAPSWRGRWWRWEMDTKKGECSCPEQRVGDRREGNERRKVGGGGMK